MNWYKRALLARVTVAETEVMDAHAGPQHRRLEGVLRDVATQMGFNKPFDFPAEVGGEMASKRGPEVSLINDDGVLFIGDAKDAENETSNTRETRSRILGYIMGVLQLMKSQQIKTACFFIATNTPEAAADWADALTLMARMLKIPHQKGGLYRFHVTQHDEQTWFAY